MTKKSINLLSKSSPPKWVSPAVALTSKTPLSIDNNETSNVPPPKSKINTCCSSSFGCCKPYANAAAVGSLIIRWTFNPEIVPASFVELRWLSLKYAGTVTTASLTCWPKKSTAVWRNLPKTIAEISSGRKVWTLPKYSTSTTGLPFSFLTVNGHNLISRWTSSSL